MSQTRNPAPYIDHLVPLNNAQQFIGLLGQVWAGVNLAGTVVQDATGTDITDATLIQVPAAWINSGNANSGVKLHANQGVGIICNDGDTAFKLYPPDVDTRFNGIAAGNSTTIATSEAVLYFRVSSGRYIAVTLTKSA